MNLLDTIQKYENMLSNDCLSTADFYEVARKMENLTAEWVELTKPIEKPAQEIVKRIGELTVIGGNMTFNLYPAIITTQNNF